MKQINYIDLGVHSGEEIDIVLNDYNQYKEKFKLSIYGVEADVDWCSQLKYRYEDWEEVKIYNKAISNDNKEIKLFLDNKRLGSSIFPTKRNVTDKYILVQGIKITDFIKKYINDFENSINVIKLNIEGAELLVYQDLIDNNMLQYIDLFCGHPSHDILKVNELSDKIEEYFNIIKNNNIQIKYLCGEVNSEQSINIFENILK
tara:strand:- start:130 stop:738 length:609 start_codon:yes stop_codon:yes gene_type:complete